MVDTDPKIEAAKRRREALRARVNKKNRTWKKDIEHTRAGRLQLTVLVTGVDQDQVDFGGKKGESTKTVIFGRVITDFRAERFPDSALAKYNAVRHPTNPNEVLFPINVETIESSDARARAPKGNKPKREFVQPSDPNYIREGRSTSMYYGKMIKLSTLEVHDQSIIDRLKSVPAICSVNEVSCNYVPERPNKTEDGPAMLPPFTSYDFQTFAPSLWLTPQRVLSLAKMLPDHTRLLEIGNPDVAIHPVRFEGPHDIASVEKTKWLEAADTDKSIYEDGKHKARVAVFLHASHETDTDESYRRDTLNKVQFPYAKLAVEVYQRLHTEGDAPEDTAIFTAETWVTEKGCAKLGMCGTKNWSEIGRLYLPAMTPYMTGFFRMTREMRGYQSNMGFDDGAPKKTDNEEHMEDKGTYRLDYEPMLDIANFLQNGNGVMEVTDTFVRAMVFKGVAAPKVELPPGLTSFVNEMTPYTGVTCLSEKTKITDIKNETPKTSRYFILVKEPFNEPLEEDYEVEALTEVEMMGFETMEGEEKEAAIAKKLEAKREAEKKKFETRSKAYKLFKELSPIDRVKVLCGTEKVEVDGVEISHPIAADMQKFEAVAYRLDKLDEDTERQNAAVDDDMVEDFTRMFGQMDSDHSVYMERYQTSYERPKPVYPSITMAQHGVVSFDDLDEKIAQVENQPYVPMLESGASAAPATNGGKNGQASPAANGSAAMSTDPPAEPPKTEEPKPEEKNDDEPAAKRANKTVVDNTDAMSDMSDMS